ncbi:MAG: DUF4230 domain-containing protein [Anaerolineales bacterium]|nr:DUF4230 domain-containing protein [Anaerolineales bacterium]MCX7607610.1 DUF4230 domain-containing protein [Anaerolineales bacterium]MDW8226849.1 DUF4230 domain-containing protein [Anaerolineales bacterium]
MMSDKPFARFILTLFLLVALVGGALFLVNSWLEKTVNPLQASNQQLSTQIAALLHPTPTILPDPVTIVHKVQAIARLETIHYSVEKVITAEYNQGVLGPLFGDRLLFIAHGYVIAGIDMEKIRADDLWLEDGILYVRLPEAEVLVATLDNEKSYVYDRQTGLLTHGDPNLETTARQVAEQEILKAALEDGILKQARINAEVYLDRFFEALGYQNVVFLSQNE